MKHDHSIKRLLVPGALLMAAATGLVSSLGCSDLFYSRHSEQPRTIMVQNGVTPATTSPTNIDDAAQAASQAAVADGVQQDITGQITGGQMGHGDY